jgi:hypothetical protein
MIPRPGLGQACAGLAARAAVAVTCGVRGVLLLGGALATVTLAKPPLQPLYRATGIGAAEDGAIRLTKNNVGLTLREVAGEERKALIASVAGEGEDPFTLLKDGEPRHRAFLIELENGTQGDLLFNPSFITLRFGQDRRYPLGFAQLYEYLRAIDPKRLDRYEPLFAETTVTIPPGGVGRRLLLFEKFPAKAREIAFELDGLAIGSEPLTLKLTFAR